MCYEIVIGLMAAVDYNVGVYFVPDSVSVMPYYPILLQVTVSPSPFRRV